MSGPAPQKSKAVARILPIVGGFVLFSAVAVVDGRLAVALALGVIGFAVASMLLAILGKH